MSELLELLLKLNLGATLAVLVVVGLRIPIRRLFGARLGYALWAIVPLTSLVMVLPLTADAGYGVSPPSPIVSVVGFDPPPLPDGSIAAAAGLWAIGLIIGVLLVWRRHDRFSRAVNRDAAGPAVFGILRPRVVLPPDFERRYTPSERELILAHEHTHIRRRDPLANALVVLFCCCNWFNPFAHLFGRLFRVDQELACDALVLKQHPAKRRTYAGAMLKAQLATQRSPIAAYWRGLGPGPFEQRIRRLADAAPSRRRRRLGVTAVAAAALSLVAASALLRPASSEALGVLLSEATATGYVVRIHATTLSPDGRVLTSDITSRGPKSTLRTSRARRSESPYELWTGARQEGDRVRVTAAMLREGRQLGAASTLLVSGQTQRLDVGQGMSIVVTPTVRRETTRETSERLDRKHATVHKRCEHASPCRIDRT